MACGNCVYFSQAKEHQGLGDGICRRFPPTPIVIDGDKWATAYTPVTEKGWCGEWDMEFDDIVIDPTEEQEDSVN